jgi:hypothetical protein
MKIPATIRAGDTITWRDDAAADALGNLITSGAWTLIYYLRTNAASAGATVTGTAYGYGWESTLSASTTAGFAAGTWYWQGIATRSTEKHTLGAGQLIVLPALSYSGTPGALDGRSQSQQDLDAVQAAMRALLTGGAVKAYQIGNRQLTKFTIAELREWESILLARINREKTAEMIANGMGSPRNLFVRFT